MTGYKQSTTVGLLFALLSGLLAHSSLAESLPPRGPIPFEAFDQDGNGLISEQEFNSVREERMASRAAQDRPMYGMADPPAFADFDSDGDGRLTPAELTAGQQARMQQRRETGMGYGKAHGMGMGRGMPAFADFDLNGDGKIVAEEFDEARYKRIEERMQQGYMMKNLANAPGFDELDSDGDGAISEAEFAAHQARRQPQKAQ
jgi:Ca2+-binding EF-hand superfamily protein